MRQQRVQIVGAHFRDQTRIEIRHLHDAQHFTLLDDREPSRDQMAIQQVARLGQGVFPLRGEIQKIRRQLLPIETQFRRVGIILEHFRPGLTHVVELHKAVLIGRQLGTIGINCRRLVGRPLDGLGIAGIFIRLLVARALFFLLGILFTGRGHGLSWQRHSRRHASFAAHPPKLLALFRRHTRSNLNLLRQDARGTATKEQRQ